MHGIRWLYLETGRFVVWSLLTELLITFYLTNSLYLE